MSTGFSFKSPAALAPNRKAILSFEALKPGIDFPLSTYEHYRLYLLPNEEAFLASWYCLVELYSLSIN